MVHIDGALGKQQPAVVLTGHFQKIVHIEEYSLIVEIQVHKVHILIAHEVGNGGLALIITDLGVPVDIVVEGSIESSGVLVSILHLLVEVAELGDEYAVRLKCSDNLSLISRQDCVIEVVGDHFEVDPLEVLDVGLG